MAAPPSLRKAPARDRGGPAAGGGATVAGPYADVDTIDEPDAAAPVARAGSVSARGAAAEAPAGPSPAAHAPAGPGRAAHAATGAGGAALAPAGPGRAAHAATGAGGAADAPAGPYRAGPAAPGTDGGRQGAVPPPGSGGSALAWLWGEQGQPGEYLLASRSVTVGRDPGSDIVLHERTVSREHARFSYDGSQWWLVPASSAGPTWVNGRPLAPGQRLPVTDGDRLRFGYHTQLRLLVPGDRG